MKSLVITLLLFSLFACNKQAENYLPQFSDKKIEINNSISEYIFAVHPLHNPERLQKMFGPMIDYINHRLKNAKLKIEASNSYNEYNEKIKTKRIDFLLPNPYQTMMANKYGYHVFAKMGDDEIFAGIGLIRTDSYYKSLKDLKNKVITFPAPTALAAVMMPQVYMQKNGLNLKNKEAEIKYVGSQESSILAVFHNNAEMGVTWVMAWNSFANENPEIAKKLKIFFKTKPLINNSLMVRDDIDKSLVEQIQKIIVNMHNDSEGMKILDNMKLSKFENANDQTYKVVEKFLNEYKMTFGELP
jgi:phosphonate transport system substrate-binding protein